MCVHWRGKLMFVLPLTFYLLSWPTAAAATNKNIDMEQPLNKYVLALGAWAAPASIMDCFSLSRH